jgi:uncharacterized membrane protein
MLRTVRQNAPGTVGAVTPKPRDVWATALAGLLAIAGVAHFVVPEGFDAIVPHLLPGSRRMWSLAAGVAELVVAAGVAQPRTRRVGATGAAILFVAVFPANVQMAVDWRSRPAWEFAGALLRLPLQIPLIWWAIRVRTRAAERDL